MRNGFTVACNTILPLAAYTVVSYASHGLYIVLFAVCGAVAAAACAFIVYRAYYRRRPESKADARRRRFICAQRCKVAVVLALCIAMVPVAFRAVFRSGAYSAKAKAVEGVSEEDGGQTIENNIVTIRRLRADMWSSLSVTEKLDVMQTVANIEAHYLGLPHELNVETGNINNKKYKDLGTSVVWGYYYDPTHTVMISIDILENKDSVDMINTVCHEAYHAYEYRLADIYRSLGNDPDRNLLGIRDADKYIGEFASKKPENYAEYYTQACETDSRAYAETATYEYVSAIYPETFGHKETGR